MNGLLYRNGRILSAKNNYSASVSVSASCSVCNNLSEFNESKRNGQKEKIRLWNPRVLIDNDNHADTHNLDVRPEILSFFQFARNFLLLVPTTTNLNRPISLLLNKYRRKVDVVGSKIRVSNPQPSRMWPPSTEFFSLLNYFSSRSIEKFYSAWRHVIYANSHLFSRIGSYIYIYYGSTETAL